MNEATTENYGKYDLAPISNALVTVMGARDTAGLDCDAIYRDFEKQLVDNLTAQSVDANAWNKLINHDTVVPGSTYEDDRA